MSFSVLAEGGTVGTKIKFLPFGAYGGGNRPKQKKTDCPYTSEGNE